MIVNNIIIQIYLFLEQFANIIQIIIRAVINL